MCGFVGFIQRSNAPDLVLPMLKRIVSRGPDGEGSWTDTSGDWFVALGHRRLAILDIAGGAQPMSTPSGSSHLAYNGELYNFRPLREALERQGVAFSTRSDTEVLLRHTEMHWADGLPALSGMFAFALWDKARRRLLLARDRIGIKPLYYARLADGGLAFASELTALLAHPSVSRRISPAGLESYFFCDYALAPLTLIEGARKLEPGHFVEWHEGELSDPRAFFELRPIPDAETDGDLRNLAEELWSRLRDAVKRQMIADVPIGVFLSGGIDSSSVATLAQECADQPLRTFSVAFDDPTFDESSFARQVARRIGSRHIEDRLTESNVLSVIDEALSRLDEPLADPSYLPTYLVSRLAASHVKVALGGDGGDEVFGGYPTYGAHAFAAIYGKLPLALRRNLVGAPIARLSERDSYQSLEWKLKRFTQRWDEDMLRRHLRWMSNLDLADLARALPSSDGTIPSPFGHVLGNLPVSINGVMAADLRTYLPGSVLAKVDRASMAHGLEVRPPLLDNEVVDWAFRLPSALKVHRRRSKVLLKRAARGNLPNAVIDRKKKGFGIPLRAWLRGPLKDKLLRALEPSPLWASGIMRREAFAEWSQKLEAREGDYSRALWALIVLDEWVRREKIEVG